MALKPSTQLLRAAAQNAHTSMHAAASLATPSQLLPQASTQLISSLHEMHAAVDQHNEQPQNHARHQEPLYATHVQLNPVQKGAVAIFSAIGALMRPARGDLVAVVGETFGDAALRNMAARMRANPTGRQILTERPRITDAVVSHCWDLPSTTFGGAYAEFMGSRRFSADDRPTVRLVDDAELAYVIQRAREVHDLWHVLFGCGTNVFGELALKAVEFVQTGLPMAGLAVAGAQFKLDALDRQLLWRTYIPWAAQAGLRSADLMCLYYEKHFEEDLEELRARWRILPAPQPPAHLLGRQNANRQ